MTTRRSTLLTAFLSCTAVIAAGALAMALAASTPASSVAARTERSGPPAFDPADFAHPMQNRYYPLTPGLVTRLEGTEGHEHFRQKVRVTHRTRLIAGVRVVVVRDVVRRPDGTVAETTDDWYQADNTGNVWYFGEDTATYDENGHLEGREGSWQAGRDGAEPGIIMPSPARPSTADYMEFAKGVAEDQAWVVQHKGHVRTTGGRFDDVVRTLEWSRLEPNVISQKWYAAGLGIIAERDVAGSAEHFWLVSAHRP